jgi:peptidoglycan/LPS O-acetylase OafA/YrhL
MRAAMMLLGLVIHAAVSYIPLPPTADWTFRDPVPEPLTLFVVLFIHIFRMPAFFMVAGFFTALLLSRQTLTTFIRNRGKRILLPFIAAWIVLYPIRSHLFAYGRTGVWEFDPGIYQIGWTTDQVLIHLWFLYLLIFMYSGTLMVRPLLARLPKLQNRLHDTFLQVLRSRWRLILVSLPMAALLFPSGYLATPKALVPVASVFAAYTYCFFVGYQLYALRRELERLFQAWPAYVLLALLASGLNQYAVIQLRSGNVSLGMALLSSLAGGLACWGMVFGSVGFFLRYFSKASRKLDYLVDASYWVYLVHVPIVAGTAIYLNGIAIPSYLKVLLGITVGAALSLATYALLVRYTWIGNILHGPRQKPVHAAADAPLLAVKAP